MAASSKTITTVRRPSAPRVLLATRAHVDLHEAGLTSIAGTFAHAFESVFLYILSVVKSSNSLLFELGAREVIAALRARKSVTKLILGHNELGDEGCKELFRFLCTSDGRRYHIAEISLNSNGIGDIGLEAISNYIQGNVHLRELFLQNVSHFYMLISFNPSRSHSHELLLYYISCRMLSRSVDRFVCVFSAILSDF